MGDPRKPPLGAEVYEQIAFAQYEIEKVYWEQLQPLVVLPSAYIAKRPQPAIENLPVQKGGSSGLQQLEGAQPVKP